MTTCRDPLRDHDHETYSGDPVCADCGQALDRDEVCSLTPPCLVADLADRYRAARARSRRAHPETAGWESD